MTAVLAPFLNLPAFPVNPDKQKPSWLVIDVENNGLFDYKKPADDPAQPRLASLGLILLDPDFNQTAEHEILVKPDNWSMHPEATAVNGLTDAILQAQGVPVAEALALYASAIQEGRSVASYNCQTDCKQLRGELRRANLPDLFEQTPNVCLMRACLSLKVKKDNGKGGWPRLEDVCRHFNLEPEPKPHRAIEGARRAAQVLRCLAQLGKLPEPSIHYAKEPKP